MGLGKLVGQAKDGVLSERPRPQAFKAATPAQETLDPRGTWEGSIHRMLLSGLRTTRQFYPGPREWLSPSTLSKFCPRAWTMAFRMGIPLIDDIDINGRWYMDGGNAFHKMFQEEWLGPLGIIKGGWECQRCLYRVGIDPADLTPIHSHGEDFIEKVTARSAVTMPKKCPRCGMQPGWKVGWRYIEPLLYDVETMICGWTDGLLITHDEEDELWDLKTKASTEGFQYVKKAPNREDVVQLSWYLSMAGLRRGRLLYLDRAAKKLSEAIAEHTFTLDTEMIEGEKEKVRVFRKALQDPQSSLPACPDGGYRKYGPCDCRGLQDAWEGHGR
jgi:hypothetical protein